MCTYKVLCFLTRNSTATAVQLLTPLPWNFVFSFGFFFFNLNFLLQKEKIPLMSIFKLRGFLTNLWKELLPKLEIYKYKTNVWETSIHKWITVMGKYIMVLNKTNATVSLHTFWQFKVIITMLLAVQVLAADNCGFHHTVHKIKTSLDLSEKVSAPSILPPLKNCMQSSGIFAWKHHFPPIFLQWIS